MTVRMRIAAAAAAMLFFRFPLPVRAAASAPDVSIVDLVELEIAYTTLEEQYYRHVDPQLLLDGAWSVDGRRFVQRAVPDRSRA